MDLDYVFFLFLLPGLILVGLAGYVFFLDPGSRLGRSFALMTFLWGTNQIARALLNPNVFEYPGLLRNYIFLALPFANLYFGFEYFLAQRTVSETIRKLVPYVLLGLASAVWLLYAYDHAMLGTYDPNRDPPNQFGLLEPLIAMNWVSLMLIATLFGVAHVRQGEERRHRVFLVALIAFSLAPVYFGFFYMAQQLIDYTTGSYTGYYDGVYKSIDTIENSLAPFMAVGIWWFLKATSWRVGGRRLADDARTYGIVLLVLFVIGTVCGLLFEYRLLPTFYVPHFFVLALCWLAVAALIGTVVLRGQILNIEHRVHVVIRGGVVASVFVAVVFVAVEVAAQQLSDNLSFGVGGVAAGLLLFALHPLQRFAERVADRAVPHGRSVAKLNERERRDLYLEQAIIAWGDGKLSRKERHLLDTLRERLNLSADEAATIERLATPT